MFYMLALRWLEAAEIPGPMSMNPYYTLAALSFAVAGSLRSEEGHKWLQSKRRRQKATVLSEFLMRCFRNGVALITSVQ